MLIEKDFYILCNVEKTVQYYDFMPKIELHIGDKLHVIEENTESNGMKSVVCEIVQDEILNNVYLFESEIKWII